MSHEIRNEPVMISALEHYSYCPRQCGLIHIEHVWDENIYTMRGRDVHERVDEDASHLTDGVRREYSLPVWSRRLNLTGKADLVELHGNLPYPVEYKSGRHRKGAHEALQLCAQAVCLEEMMNVSIEKGAIYWHGSRQRKEIVLTDDLRRNVEKAAAAVHEMIDGRRLPPPVNDKRCRDCSLREACMPQLLGDKKRIGRAMEDVFEISGRNETMKGRGEDDRPNCKP